MLYYVETGSPHASYAIAEDTLPGWEVSFHRVAYDVGRAADSIVGAGLPRRLAERLHVGS